MLRTADRSADLRTRGPLSPEAIFPEMRADEAWDVAEALSRPDLDLEEVENLTRRFDAAVTALG